MGTQGRNFKVVQLYSVVGMLGSYERGPVQPIPIPDLGPTITYERRKYIVNNYFRPVRLLSAGTWLIDGAFAPHHLFDLHLSNNIGIRADQHSRL